MIDSTVGGGGLGGAVPSLDRAVEPPLAIIGWRSGAVAELSTEAVATLEGWLCEWDRDPAVVACIYRHVGAAATAEHPDSTGGRAPAQGDTPTPVAGHTYPISLPVIAGITGLCYDEALAFVTRTADLRVAGNSARFAFPSLRDHAGRSWVDRSRLVQQLPRLPLAWLVLAGQEMDAREALRVGLVGEVVPDSEVAARCRDLAHGVVALGVRAVRAEKLAIRFADAAGDAGAGAYATGLSALARLAHVPTTKARDG